jgi:hypothetical protein
MRSEKFIQAKNELWNNNYVYTNQTENKKLIANWKQSNYSSINVGLIFIKYMYTWYVDFSLKTKIFVQSYDNLLIVFYSLCCRACLSFVSKV